MAVRIREEKDTLPINHGEVHLPCVLLVDTSDSMRGGPIAELNRALKMFIDVLKRDSQAMGRVEVCVISFNSTVEITVPFMPAVNYVPPVCSAGGMTSMNEAVLEALNAIEARKQHYKESGIRYYRPWVFLMTDGYATDEVYKDEVLKRLREYQEKKKVNFFPMGIGEQADYFTLKEYAGNGVVLKANAENFSDAFVWLSTSLSVVSNSNPDDKINTPEVPRTVEIIC